MKALSLVGLIVGIPAAMITAQTVLHAGMSLPGNEPVNSRPIRAANAVTPVAHVENAAVEVDHLGEEPQPADYAALANPNMRGLLPPVEFAHPYRGRLLLLRGLDQETLRRNCEQPAGLTVLGCARKPRPGELPLVMLADDATVRAAGWTRNLNELHEAGHLNGAWDHQGWRDLALPGVPAVASPKPAARIVVAQAAPPEDRGEYVEPPPPPPRRPRPLYHEPYPPYGPPPGWIFIPSEQRAMPCLPTLMTFGVLRFCI
jgi:hypothetical protein